MTRPRIRTIKPELWQDEKIGAVSRDARLLFVGLITMADDDGRFRAQPSVILGHAFPYDDDAPKRLTRWLTELLEVGLIQQYEVDGRRYGVLPNWKKHQRISHPSASILPPPSLNGSAPIHGKTTEGVRK